MRQSMNHVNNIVSQEMLERPLPSAYQIIEEGTSLRISNIVCER